MVSLTTFPSIFLHSISVTASFIPSRKGHRKYPWEPSHFLFYHTLNFSLHRDNINHHSASSTPAPLATMNSSTPLPGITSTSKGILTNSINNQHPSLALPLYNHRRPFMAEQSSHCTPIPSKLLSSSAKPTKTPAHRLEACCFVKTDHNEDHTWQKPKKLKVDVTLPLHHCRDNLRWRIC